MVSRRNYFTITVILFVVFFLFQFTNVALEVWNDYETNTYIVNMEELPDRSQVYRVGEGDSETSVTGQTETQDADYVPKDVVIYIGDKEDSVGKVVHTWVMYSKRNKFHLPWHFCMMPSSSWYFTFNFFIKIIKLYAI